MADTSWVDIDLTSGVVLNAAIRLQLNVFLPELNMTGMFVLAGLLQRGVADMALDYSWWSAVQHVFQHEPYDSPIVCWSFRPSDHAAKAHRVVRHHCVSITKHPGACRVWLVLFQFRLDVDWADVAESGQRSTNLPTLGRGRGRRDRCHRSHFVCDGMTTGTVSQKLCLLASPFVHVGM